MHLFHPVGYCYGQRYKPDFRLPEGQIYIQENWKYAASSKTKSLNLNNFSCIKSNLLNPCPKNFSIVWDFLLVFVTEENVPSLFFLALGKRINLNLSRLVTKPKCGCAPSEDSDEPGIRPVRSVFACAQWVAKGPSFLHADSEDSDLTGRMPRLIWVFAGRTLTLLVLSRGRSFSFVNIYTVVMSGLQPDKLMFSTFWELPELFTSIYTFGTKLSIFEISLPQNGF